MYKKIIAAALILCLIASCITVYADDSAVGGTGKTVYPVSNTDITMVSENINITVDGEISKVNCEFVFKNSGNAKEIAMGFPEEEKGEGDGNPAIYDFKAWAKGKECKVTKKPGTKPVENAYGDLVYPYWHTFNVQFQKNETVTVKNTYWVYNGIDTSGATFLTYVLKTGAVWKGKIGKVDVTVNVIGYMPYFGLQPDFETSYKPNSVSEYGVFKWHMENIEPTKDIRIYYVANFDRHRYNRCVGVDKFWDEFFKMDYADAQKYIPELLRAVQKNEYPDWRDNVYLSIAAVYFYNKDYKKAGEYINKLNEPNGASLYYQTLIYKNYGDYKKMKACLDKLLKMYPETDSTNTMRTWALSKYKTYEKYFKGL